MSMYEINEDAISYQSHCHRQSNPVFTLLTQRLYGPIALIVLIRRKNRLGDTHLARTYKKEGWRQSGHRYAMAMTSNVDL